MTLPVQRASMIRDAMVHLKQKKGASLAQIRKHLESNYAEKLDAANQKMLSSTLKGLVQKGKIQKTGKVYELSKAGAKSGKEDDDAASTPSRRRRFPHGRCKTHRRYHKKSFAQRRRRRRSKRHLPTGQCKCHRHWHKRNRRHKRRRRRSKRALPHGKCKYHRRYHKRRSHRRRRK